MSGAVVASCIAILLVLVAYTAAPLVSARKRAAIQSDHAWRGMQLLRRRDQLYSSIKELEFDESLGKVERVDYDSQRRSLEAEAMAVLGELGRLQRAGDSGGNGMIERVERDLAALVSGRDPFAAAVARCPECGTPRGETHRFCADCGHRFADGGRS